MHKRHAQRGRRWPVSDGAEMVRLAEDLCAIVARVTGEIPELHVQVEYGGHTASESSLEALRSTAPTIDIASARWLSVNAAVRTENEWLITYVMGLRFGRLYRFASVSVEGTDELHVDGLIANLERKLAQLDSGTLTCRDRWRKWRDNQWTVALIGTASATVIGGVLLAWLT